MVDHAHAAEPAGHHGPAHHPAFYIRIWGILLVLLLVSVTGPMLGIPLLTLITAFGIAFIKAYIVAKNFMHLDVERPIVWYILGAGLALMVLFFAAVSPDVRHHYGSRWENVAAKAAIERGMAAGEVGGHAEDAHGEPAHDAAH